MRITTKSLAALALALVLGTSAPARADVLLTPYAGVTFGGDATTEQVNYGLSLAFLGAGVFGFELDASLTPNFFDSDTDLLEDGNASTVMGNLMLALPAGGFRPYIAAGAGLMRLKATSVGNVFDLDDNSFGVNIGGGILGQFNEHVGLRGDIRYFRALQDIDVGDDNDFDDGLDLDLGGFNFWRGTLGITFKF